MIFNIIMVTQSPNLREMPKEAADKLRDIVSQLLHLEQVCDNSHIRERIVEIAFHLPIPYALTYGVHLLSLTPLYVKALSGPDTLQRSGRYNAMRCYEML